MDAARDEDAGLGVLSGASWKRRAALWGGGVAVALAAILFAKASDLAFTLFRALLRQSPYWALLATPAVFAALAWATGRGLQATRGSGIPQVIAALQMPRAWGSRHLSMRVAAAKMAHQRARQDKKKMHMKLTRKMHDRSEHAVAAAR